MGRQRKDHLPPQPVQPDAWRDVRPNEDLASATVEDYPAPALAPGDTEHVSKILHHLAAITDVGSIASILGAVVSHATRHRVRPDVIRAIFFVKGV